MLGYEELGAFSAAGFEATLRHIARTHKVRFTATRNGQSKKELLCEADLFDIIDNLEEVALLARKPASACRKIWTSRWGVRPNPG